MLRVNVLFPYAVAFCIFAHSHLEKHDNAAWIEFGT